MTRKSGPLTLLSPRLRSGLAGRGLPPSHAVLLPDPPLSSPPQAAWSTRQLGGLHPPPTPLTRKRAQVCLKTGHPPGRRPQGSLDSACQEDRTAPPVGPSVKTVHVGQLEAPRIDKAIGEALRTAPGPSPLYRRKTNCNPALKDTRTVRPKGGQCLGARGRLEGEEERTCKIL